MLDQLPASLFVQGEPLSSASWGRLVDASEEMDQAFAGEHPEGKHHPVTIEKGFIELAWTGATWGQLYTDGLSLHNALNQGDSWRVDVNIPAGRFLSRFDYMVFAVANNGMPGMLRSSRTPTRFGLFVPSPAVFPDVERVAVFVYGRSR